MTTRREIYIAGRERGRRIASWVDLPEIGSKVPKDIDYVGYDVVCIENQIDVAMLVAYANEANDRQFSPFEETASLLNSLCETKPYDPWIVFEDGIRNGMEQELLRARRAQQ